MKDSKTATSKLLAWTIIIFYIVAFFTVEYAYIKYDKELFSLFNSILPIPMTVILSYFGKAGMENYQKIRLGNKHEDSNTDIVESEEEGK